MAISLTARQHLVIIRLTFTRPFHLFTAASDISAFAGRRAVVLHALADSLAAEGAPALFIDADFRPFRADDAERFLLAFDALHFTAPAALTMPRR